MPRGHWHRQRRQVTGEGVLQVRYHRTIAVRAVSCGLLLLSAGLVGWLAAGGRIRLLALVTTGGLIALFLPAHLADLGPAVFLGAIVGSVWSWIRSGRGARESTACRTSVAAIPQGELLPWLLMLGGVGLASATGSAGAAQAPGGPPATEVKEYRILVPVDRDQQPVGPFDYLPVELNDAINRRVALATSEPLSWLVRSASYRVSLRRSLDSGDLEVDQLSCSFTLEVTGPARAIRLPLDRRQLQVLEARLSGRPILAEWDAEGQAITVQVAEQGTYELELNARPTVLVADGLASLDLTIPRIARSRLFVKLPPDAEAMEFPTALGPTTVHAETGELLVELGPIPSLSMRWPERKGGPSRRLTVEADELLWMTIRPHSVLVQARLRWTPLEGDLQQVRLLTAQGLRLSRYSSDVAMTQDPPVRGTGRQELTFRLAQPTRDPVTVQADFLLTETAGVGNLPPPLLEAVADQVARRWLAVSLDGQLEAAVDSTAPPTVPGSDFAAAWPAADPPRLAFRTARHQEDWSLAVRYRELRTVGRQQTVVQFGAEGTELASDFELETSNGQLFQHQLQTPPNMQVERVSVVQDGVEQVARHAHDREGRLRVFMTRGVEGRHVLRLQGRQPHTAEAFELPIISLANADLETRHVHLQRLPEADAVLETTAGLTVVDPSPPDMPHLPPARALGSYSIAAQAPSVAARVRVWRNVPRPVARLITVLERHGDRWTAVAHVRLQVTNPAGGKVDMIRLEIPPEWSEALQLDQEVEHRVVQLPGSNRRQLLITPPQAIDTLYQLSIRGELNLSQNQQVKAPAIDVLDTIRTERLLVLPTRWDERRIAWETSRLQATPLPRNVNRDDLPPGEYASYRVLSNAVASITEVQAKAETPSVHLADVHLRWQEDGKAFGLVLFDVEPAGAEHCELELPQGGRLLHVSVAGLPGRTERLGPDRYRLQLGPPHLPHRVHILFSARVEVRPGGLHLAAPRFVELPVRTTLWTVLGPRGCGPGSSQDHLVARSAAQLERLRFERMQALVETGVPGALGRKVEQIESWYRPWCGRISASDRRLSTFPQIPNAPRRFLPAERNRLQAELAERLRMSDIWQAVREEPSIGDGVTDRGWTATWTESAHDYFECDGSVSQISLTFEEVVATNPWSRWGIAVGGLALACLLSWSGARAQLLEAVTRWPAACGVLLGLGWWLWLSPSVLGWLIILLSTVGALGQLIRPPGNAEPPRDGSHSRFHTA